MSPRTAKPIRSASLEHPLYGTVIVEAWTGLHVQDAAPG